MTTRPEQAVAVRRASRDLSGADADDVAHCERYYLHLEEMARGRLDMLSESYRDSDSTMVERMVNRLALDAKLNAIRDLGRTGELPERVADGSRQQLEAEHAVELRTR